MKYFTVIVMLLTTFLGCSKKEENTPIDPGVTATGYIRGYVNSVNWYSNSITTSKSGVTRVIKATQNLSNNQNYSSAILEFKISVNQPGNFGIGEDEPGYVYFVRAYYTLIGKNGNSDLKYTAYYEDTSLLTIDEYDSDHLYGSFNFIARTADTLNTIQFTGGLIQIDY